MAKRLVTLTEYYEGREIVLNFDHVLHLARKMEEGLVVGTVIMFAAAGGSASVTESLEEVIDLAEKAN